jgi:DNA-binding TFAR19-related protein (PDSD5 family)
VRITGASLLYTIIKYNNLRKTSCSNTELKKYKLIHKTLTINENENLENLYRIKFAKYIENCITLAKSGETHEVIDDPFFDVDLKLKRKISDDMWFKSPVLQTKESPDNTDTEDEWCILSE